MLEETVCFINIYAEWAIAKKKATNPEYTDIAWKEPLTVDKLKAYFGVLIVLSINTPSQLRHAFSADSFVGNVGIRRVFTLRRFMKVQNYFCLYNKLSEPPRASQNYKYFKVQYLVEKLTEAFPKYFQHSECVTIDKSIQGCR